MYARLDSIHKINIDTWINKKHTLDNYVYLGSNVDIRMGLK